MTTYIYRDFNREYSSVTDSYTYDVGFIGSISINVFDGCCVEVMVEGLQESGSAHYPIDYPCGQGYVRVSIEPTLDLYTAIIAIMDKITADHQYMLRGGPYTDFVLCSDTLVQEHPELCRPGSDHNWVEDKSYMGGHWMYFTRETLQYVDVLEDHSEMYTPEGSEDGVLLYGNVGMDFEFTYDYPIISNRMGQEYYEMTRGKRVCDLLYKDVYPEPEYTQEICFVYRDFLDSTHGVQVFLLKLGTGMDYELLVLYRQKKIRITILDPSYDLYSTIVDVLDQLTEDNVDTSMRYNDFVQCSSEFAHMDPQLCRDYYDNSWEASKILGDLGGGWWRLDSTTFQYMHLSDFVPDISRNEEEIQMYYGDNKLSLHDLIV